MWARAARLRAVGDLSWISVLTFPGASPVAIDGVVHAIVDATAVRVLAWPAACGKP